MIKNGGNTPKIVSDVTDKIVNTINEHSLLEGGDSILVAVSGGADSVCLLSVLKRISSANGFKIYAAHLNHGIRGLEADEDEEYVKHLCAEMGVKCFTKRVDVPLIARTLHMTEEEAGRNERYKFFGEICADNNITKIATAHNKNDQAETVLMRIIRGSGISGLCGIKYKREDGVIRPLLDVCRAEIEDYLKALNIDFRTDKTNNDDDYTRNRIRHKLLPLIESEFNPSAVNTLSAMAENLSSDAEFIDGYSKRLYERLRAPLHRGRYSALHISSLKAVSSKGITSRMIVLCAKEEMGERYSLEKKHIELVLDMLDDDGVTSVSLPGGLTVSTRYGWLEFLNNRKNRDNILNYSYNPAFSVEVRTDKRYNIEELGVMIDLTVCDKNSLSGNVNDVCLDADKLGVFDIDDFYLVVRSRREGDRIAVFRNGNTKKLKRLFIDNKIPSDERDRVPIVCTKSGDIAAVLGVRVSESYKMTRRTKNVLVINYERYED